MQFGSTRDPAVRAGLDEALQAGLAPDGGLYVPLDLPRVDPARIPREIGLPACAVEVLTPFFEGSSLAGRLDAICRQALDIELPLVALEDDPAAWILELFHGPTAAFKDFAAR
ncbi:MAG: threonine synthase, partial [Wenzhouxiangellaceae bacterium]